jgi:hypothetical protein
MGQFDPEIKSAEVRHVPVQSRQPQQALNKARRLAERYPEQHFHRQTSLDRGVTEYPRSAPFAGRFCIPVHLRIEPDRKRAAAFQRPPLSGLLSAALLFSNFQVGGIGQ